MTERSAAGLETLLVGIDGACFRVLDELFDSGDTPHLASLFEGGVSGPLQSQIPPWTASAWPSLYTGANPGKHGVFGFLDFEGYDWDVVNATDVNAWTMPELLDHRGRSSVVVNAPVTYPPPEIDGAVVPGYLAPESPRCHPAGLLEEIEEAIGGYRVYASHEGAEGVSRADRVAEYTELAAMRGAAFRYLVDRFDPSFGFLQFQHTDTALHEFPEDHDALSAVYGAVDDEVGAVCEACDPDTVIVASDHGLGPYEKRVRVNELLRDAGFVDAVRGGQGMPTWASIRNEQLVNGEEGGHGDRGWIERAVAAGAAVGLTAQRFGDALDRIGVRDAIEHRVPAAFVRAASEQVDFPNSAAYVRSRVECGVRINLEGREPNGVVPTEEYDAVRQQLIELLSDVETPDGAPVFADVAPREKYFHGPEADQAVDVVAVPRAFDYYVTTWLMGERFADPKRPGWDHKRNGVIAAAGDGVDASTDLAGAHLFDVAPTVLATLGVQWSERMDGQPLPFVADPGSRSYPDSGTDQDVTVTDEKMEAQLAHLGYLE